ncbi:hypothetical protein CF319_g7920 [Tilletia indica]|nr:hypothetical protein CF319_g7920 [Tilletia indica]
MRKTGKSQTAAAGHFQDKYPGIKQPLISIMLEQEEKLRERAEDPSIMNSRSKRPLRCPEMEKELGLWVTQTLAEGKLRLSGAVIITKASQILDKIEAAKLSMKRPTLSSGWLSCFKSRHGLKSFRLHGEAASSSVLDVRAEQERLKVLLDGWERKNIFNMDETASFYRLVPDRCLMQAYSSKSGVKIDKTRITIALCANADGSEQMEPIIIGRAAKPRCFNKHTAAQLGFRYYWNNKTAWMTGGIFTEWILSWDADLRRSERKILLLVDNFSGHSVDTTKLTNIRLEFFKANLTAHVQPLDGGIIRCFKAKFRALTVMRALERHEQGELDIYAIDQLKAMTLVKEAWNSVSAATISNCWKHVDILPSSPDQQAPSTAPAPTTPTAAARDVSEVPEVVAAEQEAEAALNTFYRTDAVSSSARISRARAGRYDDD